MRSSIPSIAPLPEHPPPLRGHAPQSASDHKRCSEVHGGVRSESSFYMLFLHVSRSSTTADQRRPRRDWPACAVVGGLVLCMGPGRRVSTLPRAFCSSIRRLQSVQIRPHHLVRLHRQLPNASLLRPARDLCGRLQEAPRRNARPLHRGRHARHSHVRPGHQVVAVL